jgi:hypothetical protein
MYGGGSVDFFFCRPLAVVQQALALNINIRTLGHVAYFKPVAVATGLGNSDFHCGGFKPVCQSCEPRSTGRTYDGRALGMKIHLRPSLQLRSGSVDRRRCCPAARLCNGQYRSTGSGTCLGSWGLLPTGKGGWGWLWHAGTQGPTRPPAPARAALERGDFRRGHSSHNDKVGLRSQTAQAQRQRPLPVLSNTPGRSGLCERRARSQKGAWERAAARRGNASALYMQTRVKYASPSIVRVVGGEQRASGAASLPSGERSPSHGVY